MEDIKAIFFKTISSYWNQKEVEAVREACEEIDQRNHTTDLNSIYASRLSLFYNSAKNYQNFNLNVATPLLTQKYTRTCIEDNIFKSNIFLTIWQEVYEGLNNSIEDPRNSKFKKLLEETAEKQAVKRWKKEKREEEEEQKKKKKEEEEEEIKNPPMTPEAKKKKEREEKEKRKKKKKRLKLRKEELQKLMPLEIRYSIVNSITIPIYELNKSEDYRSEALDYQKLKSFFDYCKLSGPAILKKITINYGNDKQKCIIENVNVLKDLAQDFRTFYTIRHHTDFLDLHDKIKSNDVKTNQIIRNIIYRILKVFIFYELLEKVIEIPKKKENASGKENDVKKKEDDSGKEDDAKKKEDDAKKKVPHYDITNVKGKYISIESYAMSFIYNFLINIKVLNDPNYENSQTYEKIISKIDHAQELRKGFLKQQREIKDKDIQQQIIDKIKNHLRNIIESDQDFCFKDINPKSLGIPFAIGSRDNKEFEYLRNEVGF